MDFFYYPSPPGKLQPLFPDRESAIPSGRKIWRVENLQALLCPSLTSMGVSMGRPKRVTKRWHLTRKA